MGSADDEEYLPSQTIKSCPFPVDLNSDGHLDLVSGNSAGTFAVFWGDEKGQFTPDPTWLKSSDGTKLSVSGASGPVFYDWDSDGDLDLISGAEWGGVYMFLNTGSKTEYEFAPAIDLIDVQPDFTDERILGVDHIKAPNANTRVAVGDVNGDGKPDLIVGDRQFLSLVNEGVSDEDATAKFEKWQVKHEAFVNNGELNSVFEDLDFENEENWTEEQKKAWEDYIVKADELDNEFNQFAKELQAGFVWVYLQK